eukprot:TRINITY_DN176_c0_g1_i13.p1 TRINITY_DN176_c0_g1~~TRINITY_DN176_c0_g1_i13.p1  ORF type:complete len:108 (-),score=34.81 TRINITY_DN176_c0_g1_i13:30-332(-)
MIRRPPRSTLDRSSAASDVYKRQGYEWTVEREKLKIVNHVDKELVGQTKSDDSGRVGAPGKQLFTFMPKSEGMDTIVFLYRKNWEPNDRSTIYNLRVNVE